MVSGIHFIESLQGAISTKANGWMSKDVSFFIVVENGTGMIPCDTNGLTQVESTSFDYSNCADLWIIVAFRAGGPLGTIFLSHCFKFRCERNAVSVFRAASIYLSTTSTKFIDVLTVQVLLTCTDAPA